MGRLLYGFSAATLALAFLCASVATRSTINPNGKTTESSQKYCTNDLCRHVGKALVANRDKTIDACDDFFSHACGGRIAETPIRYSIDEIYRRDQLQMMIRNQMKSALEKKNTWDSGAVRKAKIFYASCMDEDAINKRGIAPVVSFISANGGWPLTLSSANSISEEEQTLEKIHQNYVRNGAFWPLVRIGTTHENMQTKEKTLMTVWQLPPSKDWKLLKMKSMKNSSHTYENYMKSVIYEYVKSGAFNVSSGSVDEDVADILDFEEKLWDVVDLPKTPYYTPCDNCIKTIADFQNRWNSLLNDRPELQIDWVSIVRRSFDETKITINESEKIWLHPVENLTKIADLLKKTPMRTIVNYIQWYVIYNTLTFTSAHKRIINGHEANQRPDWCFEQRELARAYSSIYVKNYFTDDALNKAKHMAYEMQDQFKREINQSKSLTNEEKSFFNKRISSTQIIIGQPDSYNDPEKNDEYYDKLDIGSNFFENAIELRWFYEIRSRESYRGPNVAQEWSSFSAEPHFDIDNNILVFPAGALQKPLFHPDIPASMNYGYTGLSMGLEIAWQIIDGVYRQEDPMLSESASKVYNDRSKCFVDRQSKNEDDPEALYFSSSAMQYLVYTHTGLELALKAYLSYEKEGNVEGISISPSENLSAKKVFFYSVAGSFCARYDPVESPDELSHSRNRVNSALSAIKHFSDAFACPVNSRMNPDIKCSTFD